MRWPLSRSPAALLDGAWGTELIARGLPPGESPDLWNLDNPKAVREVAAAYVEAGCDVLLTNTFGANPWRLPPERAGEIAAIARAGAELSRSAADRARGRRVLVFGSIGPSGKMLVTEEVTEAALAEGFAKAAKALAAGLADGIVLETFADLGELRAALRGAREGARLPTACCLSFDSGSDEEPVTMMGVTPEAFAAEMQALGVSAPEAIGANCGRSAAASKRLVERLRAAWKGPLWIKPNAGAPELADGKTLWRETPESFAASARALIAAGADAIGGCCGTSPSHLAAVARAMGR